MRQAIVEDNVVDMEQRRAEEVTGEGDAVDTLATWRQTMSAMNEQRLNRSLRPGWKPRPGPMGQLSGERLGPRAQDTLIHDDEERLYGTMHGPPGAAIWGHSVGFEFGQAPAEAGLSYGVDFPHVTAIFRRRIGATWSTCPGRARRSLGRA